MSISGHLKDLRKRVLLSLLGILVGAVGGWFLYEPVMDYITAPLLDIQDANTQINFPTIGAALDLKLRVSLWVGRRIRGVVATLFSVVVGLIVVRSRPRWGCAIPGVCGAGHSSR